MTNNKSAERLLLPKLVLVSVAVGDVAGAPGFGGRFIAVEEAARPRFALEWDQLDERRAALKREARAGGKEAQGREVDLSVQQVGIDHPRERQDGHLKAVERRAEKRRV